jgi:hypothetical protein
MIWKMKSMFYFIRRKRKQCVKCRKTFYKPDNLRGKSCPHCGTCDWIIV